MRKILLTLLLIAVLAALCVCPTVTAAAATANDVTIVSEKTFDGKELVYSARITQTEGFITLFVCVEFDGDALALTSVEHGTLYSKMIYCDNSETVKAGTARVLQFGYAGQGENVTDLGSLFVLHFKVKEGAPNGKHSVKLYLSEVGYKSGSPAQVLYNPKYGESGMQVDPLSLDGNATYGNLVAEETYLVTNGAPAPEKAGRTLVIVLAVVGSVILVAGLCLVAFFLYKKKQKKPIDPTQKTENGNGKND